MTITFIYKCRRCGGIDRNPKLGSTDGDTTMAKAFLVNAIVDGPFKEAQKPEMNSLHHCADKGVGITDLIGCEPES